MGNEICCDPSIEPEFHRGVPKEDQYTRIEKWSNEDEFLQTWLKKSCNNDLTQKGRFQKTRNSINTSRIINITMENGKTGLHMESRFSTTEKKYYFVAISSLESPTAIALSASSPKILNMKAIS